MARYYIDVDVAYKALDETTKGKTPEYCGIVEDCMQIIDNLPAADVAPRSEVDNWYQLYHSIKEELKQEKMYHRETDKLCDRYYIESQQAKRQGAREIFEEIEKLSSKFMNDQHYIFGDMLWDINELKKKYTEGGE